MRTVNEILDHLPLDPDETQLVELTKACLAELALEGEGVLIERAILLRNTAKALRTIMESLDLSNWTVHFAYNSGTVNRAFISIDNPSKDALKRIRFALACEGYSLESHSSDTEVHREMWYLKNDALLQAWYYGDKSTCKYVKVGEKTVDVMELQCDDGKPLMENESPSD